jgi:cell division septation protein DedD
VASTRDDNAARQSRSKLREAGFPAEIATVRDGYGNEEYYVRIGGLAGARDAQALAAKLKALGFAEARAR